MAAGVTVPGDAVPVDAEQNLVSPEKDAINILDKYSDDDLFSTLLRYGLYYGACFQLMCILASFLLPLMDKRTPSSTMSGSAASTNSNHESTNTLPTRTLNYSDVQSNNRRSHKLRKQDKKKRR